MIRSQDPGLNSWVGLLKFNVRFFYLEILSTSSELVNWLCFTPVPRRACLATVPKSDLSPVVLELLADQILSESAHVKIRSQESCSRSVWRTLCFKMIWNWIFQLQINGTLEVTSSQKEKYKCLLPELKPKQSTTISDYDGPLPINLLKPLFSQKICSYRLESYWSYEVCHGRYIRQYHEERDGMAFGMVLFIFYTNKYN